MSTRILQSRRGAAAVAMVLVMVMVQLLMVGTVVSGARDQNLTVQRLDSTRSFYAVEAGMNMAVREAMRGLDEDGDGVIGSISNDGNANNDPLLQTARVYVSRAVAGGITTMTANARSGAARRRAQGSFNGTIGGSPQTLVVAYGRAGQSQPRYCSWNGSVWSASQPMPSIGSTNIKWVRMKLCPARNETMFIAESDDDHVNIEFFNGTTWSTPYLVSTDSGGTNDRPEDCAYEQLSDNGLSVYWKGTSSIFGYRRYNGTTFLPESTLSSPFATEDDWVTLAVRPLTNEIMILAVDGNAGGPLVSSYWNGASMGAWTTVCTTLESNNEECFGMVYEAQSRRGLCVYSETGQTTPRYRTWNGAAWSAQGSLPSIGGVAKWVRLAPDPSSNNIVCATLDSQNDINLTWWNGTTWGAPLEITTVCSTWDRRQFDIVFERTTGHGIVVYGQSGINTPRYRTWNGAAWSSEMSLPNIGSTTEVVQLGQGFAAPEAFAAISDSLRRLHLLKWNGSSWSGDTIVETSLSGDAKQQSFSLPEPTPAPHPRLLGWKEVAP